MENFKAVILAAGRGERLRPLTDSLPKVLLPLAEESILEYQVRILRELHVENRLVVTGFRDDLVRRVLGNSVEYIYNQRYSSTNNIYSLKLAEGFAKNGFILLNGDVLFPKALLAKLLSFESSSALLVDDQKHLDAEDMKVKVENKRIVQINKTMDPIEASGEYIGLAKFSEEDAHVFFREINEIVGSGQTYVWYENALEKALDKIVMRPLSTEGLELVEVDIEQDYLLAKALYCKLKKVDLM